MAELCCPLGSRVHKEIHGLAGWRNFGQNSILFLLVGFFGWFIFFVFPFFLPPAKPSVTLVKWAVLHWIPCLKKVAFPLAEEKGGSHVHGLAASFSEQSQLIKWSTCTPSPLLHVSTSFISHDVNTALRVMPFPQGINTAPHVRKQEAKRSCAEDLLGLSFSSHWNGLEISERKFLRWQNARLIKSKWTSEQKSDELLRFPMSSVGW